MKKIVLTVMAVLLAPGSGGAAAFTSSDRTPDAPAPAAGAAASRVIGGRSTTRRSRAFLDAEPWHLVRVPRGTLH